MRLIDADALPVQKAYIVDEAGFGANFYVVDKSDIDYAPTIDAEPVKQGQWIKLSVSCGIDILECSECHTAHPNLGDNFCRDCGADMRERKET